VGAYIVYIVWENDVWNLIKSLKRNYKDDSSGTIAVNFALGFTAVIAVVAAAIDVNLIHSQNNKMQNLADSTAIAAAVSGQTSLAELQLVADGFIQASTLPDANVTVKLNNGNVLVELSKSKDLLFAGVLPGGTADLFADAETPLPSGSSGSESGGVSANYNISLVLDTTGSMISRQKLDDLKVAATDFLIDMDTNGSPDTMVGLVPFSNYVKLPTSYADETWLEAPSDWVGCMNSRKDGFHKVADFETRRLQGFSSGFSSGDTQCGASVNSAILPLTTDTEAAKAAVDAMSAAGQTYIPAGLVWGWRQLSPNAPLVEASQNPNAEKVLILLTDGQNTNTLHGVSNESKGIFHYQNGGFKQSQDEADALTLELCASMKADGIRIITIPLEVLQTKTHNMLKECASSEDDYHRAYNNAQMLNIFKNIEGDLNSVKVEAEEHVVRLLR